MTSAWKPGEPRACARVGLKSLFQAYAVEMPLCGTCPWSCSLGVKLQACLFKMFTAHWQAVMSIGVADRPAGLFLCELLACHPSLLASSSAVIELGSGTGMAGILAAKILSQDGSVPRIVLTDHDTRVRKCRHHTVTCALAQRHAYLMYMQCDVLLTEFLCSACMRVQLRCMHFVHEQCY